MLTHLRQLATALLPERCAGCGATGDAGLCAVCVAALPRVAKPCALCGLATPVASCPRRTQAWTVASVVAPFAYAPPLESYLHALKFWRARHLGRALGALLADGVAEAHACAPENGHVDALVPVPLAPRRLRERGYNQAFEIARAAAAALGARVVARGIERRESRATQMGHDAAQRHAAVRTAFAVTRNLSGLRIAIVDDVITTGATVNALARALAARGAARVDAWAVARTPEPAQAQAGARNR